MKVTSRELIHPSCTLFSLWNHPIWCPSSCPGYTSPSHKDEAKCHPSWTYPQLSWTPHWRAYMVQQGQNGRSSWIYWTGVIKWWMPDLISCKGLTRFDWQNGKLPKVRCISPQALQGHLKLHWSSVWWHPWSSDYLSSYSWWGDRHITTCALCHWSSTWRVFV